MDVAMGQFILEMVSNWEGDVEDLARLGRQWSETLGIEDNSQLTVRLVRDYAQRGILDRPRREGKAAVYGWEHLVRLLGARLLLRDGWPLQKIADEFTVMSVAEIRALLPGGRRQQADRLAHPTDRRRTDPALDVLNTIRSRNTDQHGALPPRPNNANQFWQTPPITSRATWQQDLAASRRELGEDAGDVASRPYLRLEIASGVELHIETERLRSLGRSDAHAIARVVLASLLNPRLRKEDKPE